VSALLVALGWMQPACNAMLEMLMNSWFLHVPADTLSAAATSKPKQNTQSA
jgi:hypothetical protein